MPDIVFHSGQLVAIPKTANPTPKQIMTIQETSFDFKGDLKKLMGEGQFAVDAAIGTIEIGAKCKNGELDLATINDLFFGKTIVANGEELIRGETITVAAGAATLSAGALTLQDLGIFNSVTGKQYTRVATAPTAGQYVWGANGALNFNVSENAQVLLANYVRNNITTMQSMVLTNDVAGSTVTLQAMFSKKFRDGRQLNLRFYNVIVPGINFGFKLNDYTMPEFNMEVFADPVLGVGKYSWTRP